MIQSVWRNFFKDAQFRVQNNTLSPKWHFYFVNVTYHFATIFVETKKFNQMKFSKIVLSVLFVFSSIVFVNSQTVPTEYALVSVMQNSSKELSKIIITYEDGKSTKLDLPVMASPLKGDAYINSLIEMNSQIVKTLNEMVGNGYRIVSTHGNGLGFVTYTMEKIK
jgi:hypothetical protein